jgi:hypothetical protein
VLYQYTCNNKKRAVGANARADQFVHPYLEPLPNRRFFRAVATMVGRALVVKFSIHRTADMPRQLANRLQRQLDRLALNDRYASEVNVFVISIQDGLRRAYGAGHSLQRVRVFLADTAATQRRNFGRNDWRYALLNALIRCREFCDGGFSRIGVR